MILNRGEQSKMNMTLLRVSALGLAERMKIPEEHWRILEEGENHDIVHHTACCVSSSVKPFSSICHLISILENETWPYNMFIKTWLRFPFKQVKCESSKKHSKTTKYSRSGNRQQSCQMSILSYPLPNEPTQPNPAFANRTRRSTQSCCEMSRRPVKNISGI